MKLSCSVLHLTGRLFGFVLASLTEQTAARFKIVQAPLFRGVLVELCNFSTNSSTQLKQLFFSCVSSRSEDNDKTILSSRKKVIYYIRFLYDLFNIRKRNIAGVGCCKTSFYKRVYSRILFTCSGHRCSMVKVKYTIVISRISKRKLHK